MELKLEARIKRENEISAFTFHNPFSHGLGSPEKRMKGAELQTPASGWKLRGGRWSKEGTEGEAGRVEKLQLFWERHISSSM